MKTLYIVLIITQLLLLVQMGINIQQTYQISSINETLNGQGILLDVLIATTTARR